MHEKIIKENSNKHYSMTYSEALDKGHCKEKSLFYKFVKVECGGSPLGEHVFFIESNKDLDNYISSTEDLLKFLKSLKIEEGNWSEEIPK